MKKALPARTQRGLLVLSIVFLLHPAHAATVTVHVGPGLSMTYSPNPVFIQPGDTVEWIWDASGHSVTSGTPPTPDGIFDSGVQSVPFTFSHTFPTAGTFPYYCTRHGAMMTGTVNVAVASPTPTPTCFRFAITINGTQAVPPNGSAGQGSGTIDVDTVTNQLSYNITFSGLGSPESMAHIHGFAPPGMNAGVIHTLPNGSPKIGVFNYAEGQEANILNGLSYVNIHTNTFPNGEIRGQIDGPTTPCPGTPGTPTPTPTPSTTPNPTATVSPTATPIIVSGTIIYCPDPSLDPVPNVTLNLTGDTTASTLSDGSGNYQFSALPAGNYTVTPTKAALSSGTAGINTVDVIATQKHFLNIAPLTGCRLIAGDATGDTNVNTSDVIAIQRFALASTGFANVGKYLFTPANRSYSPLTANQTGQNYDALIVGDVASGFVHRPKGGASDQPAEP